MSRSHECERCAQERARHYIWSRACHYEVRFESQARPFAVRIGCTSKRYTRRLSRPRHPTHSTTQREFLWPPSQRVTEFPAGKRGETACRFSPGPLKGGWKNETPDHCSEPPPQASRVCRSKESLEGNRSGLRERLWRPGITVGARYPSSSRRTCGSLPSMWSLGERGTKSGFRDLRRNPHI